ncbi:hypothetical protein Tco_0372156, partial [Tanacetum coccineum]
MVAVTAKHTLVVVAVDQTHPWCGQREGGGGGGSGGVESRVGESDYGDR